MNYQAFRVVSDWILGTNRASRSSILKKLIAFTILTLSLALAPQAANAQRVHPTSVGLGLADLSVVARDFGVRGDHWFVQVTVANVGVVDAPPFEVVVTDSRTGSPVATIRVDGLPAVQSVGPIPIPLPGKFLEIVIPKTGCQLDVDVEADPAGTITETSVNNNRVTFSFDECPAFDWKMPERFGEHIVTPAPNPRKIGLTPPQDYIHPPNWKVKMDACFQPPNALFTKYTWAFAGKTEETFDCMHTLEFPALGTYPVKLTATTDKGNDESIEQNVIVRDLLIVSIGDSIASGEGNPDHKAYADVPDPVWEDTRCHRSFKSGPAQAALAIERKDPHTSVTFISVACSGATINEGLLGPYKGQEPELGVPDLEAQLDQVRHLLCPSADDCSVAEQRRIDSLLVSIGGNDVHFRQIVEDCANHGDCFNKNPSGKKTITQERLEGDISLLPGKFEDLNAFLKAGLNYSNVYITEYPDPTHDASGDYCTIAFTDEISITTNPILDFFTSLPLVGNDVKIAIQDLVGKYFNINPDESKWAHDSVIDQLNNAIKAKAEQFDWIYVGGIADQFFNHGYCAIGTGCDRLSTMLTCIAHPEDPMCARCNQHWIVHLSESLRDQANRDGSMHPNEAGQKVYEDRLVDEISKRVSTPPTFEGTLDGVNCESINGWVWDRSQPDNPVLVDIYDGSTLLMKVRADQFRSDLRYYGKGKGFHSFSVPLPMRLRDGQPHSIAAKISGTQIDLYLSPVTFTCGLVGNLDYVDCHNISGSAWDSTQPDAYINVDIYDGSKRLMQGVPTGGADHSFQVPLPPSLADRNPHSISVTFAGTHIELEGSPKIVTTSGCPHPLTLSCAGDLFVVSPAGQTSVIVNYPPAVASDPFYPLLFCTPTSGSVFPVGATTVFCATNDRIAACSFIVNVIKPANIDLCLQDDTSGVFLSVNSPDGVYRFTDCNGVTLDGTGSVTNAGGVITLQVTTPDRRILATIDTNTKRGSASIHLFGPGTSFVITDTNIEDNACACP